MFTIKIKTKQPLAEQQTKIIMQAAADTGSGTECHVEGTSFTISGAERASDALAYLLGAAVGCCKPHEIERLLFLYEKNTA